jgi:hypothetical protein
MSTRGEDEDRLRMVKVGAEGVGIDVGSGAEVAITGLGCSGGFGCEAHSKC